MAKRKRKPGHAHHLGLIAGWAASVAALVALIVYVVLHIHDAQRFAHLLRAAQPAWLALALGLQLATYACAGGVYGAALRAAGHRLSLPGLARIAIEKLTVDQIFPTGGLAGNMVVARALLRMGVPASLGLEALLVDLLGFYFAFAAVALASVIALALWHDTTPVLLTLVGTFGAGVLAVPLAIEWLLRHREWTVPHWAKRWTALASLLHAVRRVSPKRVRDPKLLTIATVLQIGVFVLDGATLWVALRALGTEASLPAAIVAHVIASIAASVSFLPAGLGSFEAASTATLVLLGVPVEAALTATLLARGMTLWLPLAPGALLARRDLAKVTAPAAAAS